MSDINKKRPGTAEAVINFIRKQRTLLLTLSAAVIFITTYVLILPAITLDQQEAERQGGIDLPAAEEQAGEPSAEEQAGDGVLSCEGDGFTVDASFSAKAGLPSDTELAVSEIGEDADDYDAWRDEALAALQDADGGQAVTDLKFARFYDITLASGEEETQPGAPVDVTISYDKALKAEDADHVRIVHFGVDKKGNLKPEVLDAEDVTAVVKKGRLSEASFSAKSFSVYGVVYAEELEAQVLTDSGKTYKVTVTCDEAAEIPEGAELVVKEITEKDEDYQGYYEEAAEAAAGDAKEQGLETPVITDARLFDIEIRSDGEKIEPKAPVQVKIQMEGADESDLVSVIHFAEDGPEAIELEKNATNQKKKTSTVGFAADSFSVYTVVNVSDFASIAANGPYALVSGRGPGIGSAEAGKNSVTNYAMTDRLIARLDGEQNGRTLSGKGVHLEGNEVGGDVTEWGFEPAGNGKYRIYTGSGNNRKYIKSNYQNLQFTADPNGADAFSIEVNNNRVRARLEVPGYGNWYITNSGDNPSQFVLNNNPGNDAWMTLGKLDPNYEEQTAKKVSAENWKAPEGTDGRWNENDAIIIYRKVIHEDGSESLYALATNGSYVPVYDGGDAIYYHNPEGLDLKWHVTMSPQGYYVSDIGNTVYLAPSFTNGTWSSDEATGLTMNGLGNSYGSPIENWDQSAYAYAGLHLDESNPSAGVSPGKGDTSDTFLFAVADTLITEGQLHTVDTVNSTDLGIKMKIFNYGGPTYHYGYRNAAMQAVLGDDMTSDWDNRKSHVTKTAQTKLGADGFPVNLSGNSIAKLFTDGSKINYNGRPGEYFGGSITVDGKDANNLFLQSYYDENGMFRYSSMENFAHYNSDTGKFTVYRESGTPNIPTRNDHYYYYHGHFMPYNDLDPTVSVSRIVDQYGSVADKEEGRSFENVYGLKETPDYYVGMTLEANFVQPRGGTLENGDPVIYRFTGDDDLLVYIDGILVLDVGGIHEPLTGSINFETGKVIQPNFYNEGEGWKHHERTLYEIFKAAYDAGDIPAEKWEKMKWKDVDGNGTPDTFADYSTHSFNMFYMERGAGASNLDLAFNLQVIKSDEFTVQKELPKGVDPRFVNQSFKFQATFKDGNVEKPLYPGAKNSKGEVVCTKVIYKDRKDADGRPIEVNVPFDNEHYFTLKAGETAVFKMADENIEYNVKEVDIDQYNLEEVTIDGGGTTQHVEINDEQATVADNVAEAGLETVLERSNVIYTNYPKKQNLKITKHITEDSAPMEEGENPVFEFRVYLESTVTGTDGQVSQKLIPYSYAPYYLVGEDGHYYTLDGPNNTPVDQGTEPVVCSKTGRSGSINSIPPEYTIIIPDLTIGTHFYLEERRDNIPEGYEFVKEELTAGTYDPEDMYSGEATEDVIHRIIARDEQDHQEFDPKTIGRIKSGVDAESHVYNKRPAVNVNVKKAWDPAPEEGTTVKVELHRYAKTTKGSIQVTLLDNREAPIEGAVFELHEKGDGNAFAATGTEVTTDVNGKAEVIGLEPGSYKLVQKSTPEAYTMDGCTTETDVLTVQDNVTTAQRLEQTLENTALVTAGKVTLTVTDSGAGSGTSGAPIAGAKFDLYKDGTKIKEGCETNAEGKIIVAGLEAGNYYFVQTAAPDEYNMPSNTRMDGFEVKDQPGVAQNFDQTMTNSLKGKGTVSITLKKDTGEAISGAEFQLKQGDTEIETATTGADGTVSFNTELYEGTYTVRQVNTGSAGDEYGTAPDQTVVIEANSVTTQQKNLEVTNEEAGGNVTIKLWRKQGKEQWNWENVNTYTGLKSGVEYSFTANINAAMYPDHIWFYSDALDHQNGDALDNNKISNLDASGLNGGTYTFSFKPQQNDTTYSIILITDWDIKGISSFSMESNGTRGLSFSSAAKRFKSALSNLLGASDGADVNGDADSDVNSDASSDEGNEATVTAAANVPRTNASPAAAPTGYAEDTTFEPIEHVLSAPDWEYTFEGLKEKDANGDPYYYYVVETECSDDSYWIDSYAGDPLYQDGTITVTNKKEKKGNLKVTKEIIGDLEGVTDYNDKNYKVTIKNSAGKFLQSDKTFADTEYEFNVSVSTPLEITDIPVDTYTVTEKTDAGDVAIEHYLWNREESTKEETGTVEYQKTATVEIKNYYDEKYIPVPSDMNENTDLVIDKDWVKTDGSTTPADTDTIKVKIKVKSADAYVPVKWDLYDGGETDKTKTHELSGKYYVEPGSDVAFTLDRISSAEGSSRRIRQNCNVKLYTASGMPLEFTNVVPSNKGASTGGSAPNPVPVTYTARSVSSASPVEYMLQPWKNGATWVEDTPDQPDEWNLTVSVQDGKNYYSSLEAMKEALIDDAENPTIENLVYTMKGSTLTLEESQTSCSVRPETATAEDWVATLSKLPTYQMIEDKDGNKSYKVYSYEIEEIEVNGKVVKDNRIEDYLVNVTPPTGESTTTQITNTEIKKVNVDAEKKWLNAEGKEAIPENASVSFELYADGKATGKKVTLDGKTRTEEINADDSLSADEKQEAIAALDKEDSGEFMAWKAEWRKLPKYSDDAQTKEITYTVKEVTGYTGYTNLDPDGVSSGGIIRNKEDKLSFDVLKVAKDSKEALSGASFTIQKVKATSSSSNVEYDGEAKAGTPAVTGNDGKLSFTEIAPGYYEVKETKTPDGYVITGGAEFYVKVESSGIKLLKKVVSQGSVTFTEAAQGEKVGNVTLSVDGTAVTFTVENTPGTALPNSGGPGTTWIYLLGAILLLGSGILLAARRRVGKGA